MIAAAPTSQKAFGVRFKDLRLWSVGSFFDIGWQWPPEYIRPLSVALKRKQVEIEKKQHPFETLQLVTLHFDGTMEPRNLRGKDAFKGSLYFAHAGDVIYSKIDVRNGAIGVVPDELPNVAVSSEYPVYEVSLDVAIAEYIKLVFRAAYFRQAINSMISGASGRKRVQPSQIESLEFPLPPLNTQQAIVARWQQAQAEVTATIERVKQLEADLVSEVSEALGRRSNVALKRPKVFALRGRDLERWGVEISWKMKTQSQVANYPVVKLETVCRIGSGGTPSRKTPAYFGGNVPWVKTTEVRGEIIFETEETLTKLGLEHSSAKIYPKGSLIVAMYGQGATRGRTAKLGIEAATNQACAVLTDFSEQIEPDFLWFYFMSEYDNLRDLASGNNQPNLNAAMIASYPVPLPPLEVQREIVRRVEAGRAEIAREREAAAHKAREAEAEVEALILRTKKI